MNRKFVSAAVSLVMLVSIASCSSDASNKNADSGKTTEQSTLATATTGEDPISGSITVSAAASLTEAFTKVGEGFKAQYPEISEVTFNFDASSSLVTQIQEGAPADVFASADESNMKKLTDSGAVSGKPTIFAKNKLVIVTKKGNPHSIDGLDDLSSGITVALCNPEVPCGKYAGQILEGAGVSIDTGHITRGQNVKATLTAVTEGDADAGIVYLTDAAGTDASVVQIPDDLNVIASYPIAVVDSSGNKSAAQEFVNYLLSDAGQAILRDAGFLPPQ